MTIKKLSLKEGFECLRESWKDSQRFRWKLLGVLFVIRTPILLLSLIPLIGGPLTALLDPVLTFGILNLGQGMAMGTGVSVSGGAIAFTDSIILKKLRPFCILYFFSTVFVEGVSHLFLEGEGSSAWSLLLSTFLSLVLYVLSYFAIPLVVWKGRKFQDSIEIGSKASVVNLWPLTIVGLVPLLPLLVLMVIAASFFILFQSGDLTGESVLNSTLMPLSLFSGAALLVWVVLAMPVLVAFSYRIYAKIFPDIETQVT